MKTGGKNKEKNHKRKICKRAAFEKSRRKAERTWKKEQIKQLKEKSAKVLHNSGFTVKQFRIFESAIKNPAVWKGEKYEPDISVYSPYYWHFCRRIPDKKSNRKERRRSKTHKVHSAP
nr:hypothetical protein [uncultured Acetatifactor sp.]